MPLCARCNGKGSITCSQCDGRGVREENQLELLQGASRKCPKCNGTGLLPCPDCEGSGLVDDEDD